MIFPKSLDLLSLWLCITQRLLLDEHYNLCVWFWIRIESSPSAHWSHTLIPVWGSSTGKITLYLCTQRFVCKGMVILLSGRPIVVPGPQGWFNVFVCVRLYVTMCVSLACCLLFKLNYSIGHCLDLLSSDLIENCIKSVYVCVYPVVFQS